MTFDEHSSDLKGLTCSGMQYELLQWLEKITFPMESKFSDVDFAQRTYASAVRRIIDSGVRLSVHSENISTDPLFVDNDMLLFWNSAPGSNTNFGGYCE
jgi:cytosine/adenosine deaminase-related metal-dependent hydrolase